MIKKTVLTFILLPTILFATNPIPKDGVSGNFDLGMSYIKNTESTFQFNNLFLIKYQLGKSSISLKNNIAFINKSGEEEILNKGLQDFKYALNSKKLDLNLTLNHMYDISRSIKNRFGSGLGVSYLFTDEDDKKIGLGLAAIREKEINLIDEYKLQDRISANLDFMIKPNKNISINATNLYQPNIEEGGDFRWKTNVSFRVNLNSHFLFSINNTFNYDSRPAEGIPNTDYQLINSVSYTF